MNICVHPGLQWAAPERVLILTTISLTLSRAFTSLDSKSGCSSLMSCLTGTVGVPKELHTKKRGRKIANHT